jgi:hypothetical protein
MSVQTKTVFGTLSNGGPLAFADIFFTLVEETSSGSSLVLQKPIRATTNAEGFFSVNLFNNATGDRSTHWECKPPFGDRFSFTISDATPNPVSLSFLEETGTLPSDPQYDTILAYIQQQIASIQLGTAAQVTLDPAIPGFPPELQGAIVILDSRTKRALVTDSFDVLSDGAQTFNLSDSPASTVATYINGLFQPDSFVPNGRTISIPADLIFAGDTIAFRYSKA